MAKYQVTYACGHTKIIELFGKYAGREQRVEYLQTTDCPECYHRKQRLGKYGMFSKSDINVTEDDDFEDIRRKINEYLQNRGYDVAESIDDVKDMFGDNYDEYRRQDFKCSLDYEVDNGDGHSTSVVPVAARVMCWADEMSDIYLVEVYDPCEEFSRLHPYL